MGEASVFSTMILRHTGPRGTDAYGAVQRRLSLSQQTYALPPDKSARMLLFLGVCNSTSVCLHQPAPSLRGVILREAPRCTDRGLSGTTNAARIGDYALHQDRRRARQTRAGQRRSSPGRPRLEVPRLVAAAGFGGMDRPNRRSSCPPAHGAVGPLGERRILLLRASLRFPARSPPRRAPPRLIVGPHAHAHPSPAPTHRTILAPPPGIYAVTGRAGQRTFSTFKREQPGA